MRLIKTDLPKYHVVFSHPDFSSAHFDFFVDEKDEWTPSPFSAPEVWKEWEHELMVTVWKTWNNCDFYHSMTITTEYVIDGKVYTETICEDEGRPF